MTIPVKKQFSRLTPEEAEHFLTHGWIKVENAIDQKYIDQWMKEMWIRTGLDPNDKTSWKPEYLHLAHHHQVRNEDFCPGAWGKIVDICGGEDLIDPERERWVGDSLIINFGLEERSKEPRDLVPPTSGGYHVDNDWYRHFLDGSETALTVIHCFSDIPEGGGGTQLCEDGIKPLVKVLYEGSQGFDPVMESGALCKGVKDCSKFVKVVAKKGDTFICHGLLPHCASLNYLHYPRVISNPHITLKEPYNLNRPDGNYTLLEQTILRNLGRDSVPEWKPTRERGHWYPRNIVFKQNKVPDELKRLIAHAEAHGGSKEDVDSIYLQGEKTMRDFHRTNGFDLPVNEALGFETVQHTIT